MSGNGGTGGANATAAGMDGGDETLNGVLYSVFCEFMEGDFEMIRVLVSEFHQLSSCPSRMARLFCLVCSEGPKSPPVYSGYERALTLSFLTDAAYTRTSLQVR